MIGNLIRRKRAESLVTIEVEPPEPDPLERIALLNGAFVRVLSGGAQLVEVLSADYLIGVMRVVVRDPVSRPHLDGAVRVRYEPLPH